MTSFQPMWGILSPLTPEARHLARHEPEPRGVAFLAVLEEHLQADADAQEGLAARRFDHRLARAALGELAHAVAHRALSRHHHPVGSEHGLRDREVTATSARGATCSIALDTERRLPIP